MKFCGVNDISNTRPLKKIRAKMQRTNTRRDGLGDSKFEILYERCCKLLGEDWPSGAGEVAVICDSNAVNAEEAAKLKNQSWVVCQRLLEKEYARAKDTGEGIDMLSFPTRLECLEIPHTAKLRILWPYELKKWDFIFPKKSQI